jgi:hypothetical protein
VALLTAAAGSHVRDVASSTHGVRLPLDVSECDAGYLVVNALWAGGPSGRPLVLVPKDVQPPVVYGGAAPVAAGGAGGALSDPRAIALYRSGELVTGVVVVDFANSRLHVLT